MTTPQSFAKASAGAIAVASLGMLSAFAMGVTRSWPFPVPWSCAAFLAIGCALWYQAEEPEKYGFQVRIASGLVLLIGAVAWGEFLTGRDTAFDVLLFPRSLSSASPHPGQPAPLASFVLLLIGGALALMPFRRQPTVLVREFSLVTAITLSYFSLVEALFQPRGPTTFGRMTPVAAAFAVVAAASALAAGRNGRLLSLLRDSGPAGAVARRLMPVPLILPLATSLLRSALPVARLGDGRAISISLTILAAIALLWVSASQVLRADLLRRQAEDELRSSRDDLDRRVHLRTRELLDSNEKLAIEITNRQKFQSELQQTNAMLNSMIEAGPLAICAFNLDGTVRKANIAAHEILLPPNEQCRKLVEGAARGQRFTGFEFTSTSPETELHLNVWASPILAPDGSVEGVVIMAADVSERKAFELQVQQTQRLESLGVLAGGIAHDFNNLLTGVIGNASLLKEQLAHGSRGAETACSVLQAAERMAKLTAQMLAYSGRGKFSIERLDLSRQVAEITSLIETSIPKNVRFVQDLAIGLPGIDADISQLQQVIMNLVINAAEAIGVEHGIVELSTAMRHAGQPELDASVTGQPVPAGNYVTLQVRDTGSGMDERTQARIFDPFFTTKFTGRGLGLSAVLGIVRAHRGAITVGSQPGAGTTFRVFFPIPEQQDKVEPAPVRFSHGQGTVLVVDDEDAVRRTAQLLLEHAGYDVVTASDGGEAIRVCEDMAGKIDMILLDMTMPVMSGEETLTRLQAKWPCVPVIATSGYDEHEAQRRLGHRAAAFVQKPYTAAQLTARINDVLERNRGSNGSARF